LGGRGDLAVIAERDEDVADASLCRLFTTEDHGTATLTTRLLSSLSRSGTGTGGEGIGTRLIDGIEGAARAGFAQISLSVDADNPARGLYERLGYATLTVDDEGIRMLKEL
jgi:GNAT superfamily N-acetyltransferase